MKISKPWLISRIRSATLMFTPFILIKTICHYNYNQFPLVNHMNIKTFFTMRIFSIRSVIENKWRHIIIYKLLSFLSWIVNIYSNTDWKIFHWCSIVCYFMSTITSLMLNQFKQGELNSLLLFSHKYLLIDFLKNETFNSNK